MLVAPPLLCCAAESSGKTTLALHAMAEVQKAGGSVALIDAEHAFDPVFAKVVAGCLMLWHLPGVVFRFQPAWFRMFNLD